jgi:hypothetical protein
VAGPGRFAAEIYYAKTRVEHWRGFMSNEGFTLAGKPSPTQCNVWCRIFRILPCSINNIHKDHNTRTWNKGKILLRRQIHAFPALISLFIETIMCDDSLARSIPTWSRCAFSAKLEPARHSWSKNPFIRS